MPHDAHHIPPEGGHRAFRTRTEPNEVYSGPLPWNVADTAPQPVTEPETERLPEPTEAELAEYARQRMHRRVDAEGYGIAISGEEKPLPSHRGQPKRGFRWWVFVAWLFGGVIVALWLVLAYALGAKSSEHTPSPTVTVTESPEAIPGPRVTVRVPQAPRVVTRTRKSTVRATVTRTVPGPTTTVTFPAPDSQPDPGGPTD